MSYGTIVLVAIIAYLLWKLEDQGCKHQKEIERLKVHLSSPS